MPAFVPVAQVESPNCDGQTGQIAIVIEGGAGPFHFALNNGAFQGDATFSGLQPGGYNIYIQDSLGCQMTISSTIEPPPVLTLDFPGPLLTLVSGDSILLTPVANFAVDSFFWQPADYLDCPQCWQPTAYPEQSTSYEITAYAAGGCAVTASVQINVKLVRRVFVPNVFKPDSDGLNDAFTLYGDEHVIQILRMSIFDRWGEEIFTANDLMPNDPATGWDGRYKGKDLSPGVYVYLFKVRFSDNSTELYSGDVTIVR